MATRSLCHLTIQRPNGDIETIRHPDIGVMTQALWIKVSIAIRQAGQGECISYRNSFENRGDVV